MGRQLCKDPCPASRDGVYCSKRLSSSDINKCLLSRPSARESIHMGLVPQESPPPTLPGWRSNQGGVAVSDSEEPPCCLRWDTQAPNIGVWEWGTQKTQQSQEQKTLKLVWTWFGSIEGTRNRLKKGAHANSTQADTLRLTSTIDCTYKCTCTLLKVQVEKKKKSNSSSTKCAVQVCNTHKEASCLRCQGTFKLNNKIQTKEKMNP